MESSFPEETCARLTEYLELVNYPIAVRSSSLLEDSRYQPFAGIYLTEMLPNNHPDPVVRLKALTSAIKRVYASTYSRMSKAVHPGEPRIGLKKRRWPSSFRSW